jgi:hypothetical protein
MIDFYESLAWVLFNSWYPLVVVGLPFVNLALFAAAFIIMHTKSTINWSVVAAFFLPFLSYLLLFLACLLLDIRGRQADSFTSFAWTVAIAGIIAMSYLSYQENKSKKLPRFLNLLCPLTALGMFNLQIFICWIDYT